MALENELAGSVAQETGDPAVSRVSDSTPSPVFRTDHWWPTSVVIVEQPRVERLNATLAEIVLTKEREIKDREKPTKVAGIESGLTAYWLRYNVFNWNHPECKKLAELAVSGFREYIRTVADPDDPQLKLRGISCWANVLRHGEALDIHHHDPGFISAHYTVQAGNENLPDHTDSGTTVYYRPGFIERSQGDDVFGGPWDSDWRIAVKPTEGRLTLFPSYVRHEVKTYLGSSERISIAMDFYVVKQKVPFAFTQPRWYVPR